MQYAELTIFRSRREDLVYMIDDEVHRVFWEI